MARVAPLDLSFYTAPVPSGRVEPSAPMVRLSLLYNQQDVTRELAPFFTSFTFSDAGGSKADEVSLELDDIGTLLPRWRPSIADTLTAAIIATNYGYAGERIILPCGTFEIDGVAESGPPDALSISGISTPLTKGLRRERRYKAWEHFSLQRIAGEIATKSGLRLRYEAGQNPVSERIDQQFVSDLEFLQSTCDKYGLRLKISSNQLVIFDEARYEQRAPALTIDRYMTPIISYSFQSQYADVYKSCSVSYSLSGKKKGTLIAVFTPPNPLPCGDVLRINERVESKAQALTLGKARLREKNRDAERCTLTLPFNPRIVSGVTFDITNWRRHDGRWMVDGVQHAVSGGGSTTTIEAHRALIGY